MTALEACVKCSAELAQGGAGRPLRYCSKGCRRAAEFEVRRIQHRLESLEAQLWERRSARSFTTEARREIKRLELRLAHLLDPEADGGSGT